jgi:hypothetical protein
MDSPERFLYLTATGWTAVGSIVSAGSVIVLSIFNILNLRSANEAAVAANEQAKSAASTLNELHQKSLEDHLIRRQTAISAAREVKRNAMKWKASLTKADPGNDIALLPKNWNSLDFYTSLFQPSNAEEIAQFEGYVTGVEHNLIQFLSMPHTSRSIQGPSMNSILEQLERVSKNSDGIIQLLTQGN